MPCSVRLAQDFTCGASSNLLNRRLTLHAYEFIHRNCADGFTDTGTLARTSRVFILLLRPGARARSTVLDFLAGVHDLNDRSLVENIYKGRPAWLGQHYPDLQS